MSSQKRTAYQAHLPNRPSKFPRTTMSRSDTEPEVNASPSQEAGLFAKWRSLGWETVVHFTGYIDKGKNMLPLYNNVKHQTPPTPSLMQGPEGSPPLSVLPPTRVNHIPTNMRASSSSSSSSRPPTSLPSSSSTSTTDATRLTASGSPTERTSTTNSPPTSTFTLEASQLDAVQKIITRQNSNAWSEEGVRKRYRRKHIFDQQHKANAREALERKFYELRRATGYSSDFETFRGYCQYLRRLEELQKGIPPQRPQANKRGKSRPLDDDHTLSQSDAAIFKRAIERANKSFNSPRPPKPFSPTIEELQALYKEKDSRIRERLHPKRKPIPESLPEDVQKEVQTLLEKSGVIAKAGREQVGNKDLARLRPGYWLNDEIINFYGQLIVDRAAEAEASKENKQGGVPKPLNVHYFTSFFWPKLQTGYEKGRLAKWTKKLDIFSKDVILMAINHGNAHWTSAAINFRQKRIESYDSMGYQRKEVFRALRSYLNDEHKNKKNKPFDFTGWVDYEMENYPEQENGFDCGIFTCQTLEYLSRGDEDFNFTQKNMPYLRERMIWEIGRAKLAEPN